MKLKCEKPTRIPLVCLVRTPHQVVNRLDDEHTVSSGLVEAEVLLRQILECRLRLQDGDLVLLEGVESVEPGP